MPDTRRFLASRAWIAGGWAADVLLGTGSDGLWNEVRPGCTPAT